MQRNSLEISLSDAIKKLHVSTALALIDIFLNYEDEPAPSLSSIDTEGCSFLYLSLIAGTETITERLLELQQTDDDILFRKTQTQQRTLFWEAANQRNYKVLKKLLAIVDSKPAEHACHQAWFQAADDGSTPLHCGVLSHPDKIVKILLQKIAKTKTSLLLINQADNAGDTALHYAMRASATPFMIDLLLAHGGRLDILNNKNQTPFTLFLLHSVDHQLNMIKNVSKDSQKVLLSQYKNEIYIKPDDELLRKNYFACASIAGLKELMIAHHEFNPAIPVRHLFTSYMPSKSDPKKSDSVTNSLFNAAGIVEQIPNFAKKLFGLDTEASEPVIPDQVQLLNADKKTLNQLIDEINLFIIGLEARPKVMSYLVLIIFVINLALYLISEAALMVITIFFEDIYQEPRYKPRPNCDYPQSLSCEINKTFFDYCLAIILFGALGLFEVGMLLFIFCNKCFAMTPSISKDEWQLPVEKLKENLLDKLHHLKEGELPTQQSKIQELEEQINALRHNQNRDEVATIFNAIKNCLIDIRKDVHLSSKPFTLFQQTTKPIVIEMPSDEELSPVLDDEAVPLLGF